MKAKILLFLLLVGSLSLPPYSGVQAQNKGSDGQAFAMLKTFYRAHITAASKWPIDFAKLNAISKKYCTASLLSKIQAQLKSGQLDADPFLQAQDVDISWLKTLSFAKEARPLNAYTVSYVDAVSNEKVVIHLTVSKQGDRFKISAIR